MPSLFAGWKLEVCTARNLLDFTRFGFEWKNTAPYLIKRDETGVVTSVAGIGPPGWILNPESEPLFNKENGAQREKPPMHQIVQCIMALAELGYCVTACTSSVFGNGSNAHITWFLK